MYRELLASLQTDEKLGPDGVVYGPYQTLQVEGPILALARGGKPVDKVQPGDQVEVLLPETCFYVEAGGQVSDTGTIRSDSSLIPVGSKGEGGGWEIRVDEVRKPAAGIIIHYGEVVYGEPGLGEASTLRMEIG